MASQSTPSKGGGLSLYANLLDPSDAATPGTISRAPVVFKQATDGDPQQEDPASNQQQISAGRQYALPPNESVSEINEILLTSPAVALAL
jgi:splicing factor 45